MPSVLCYEIHPFYDKTLSRQALELAAYSATSYQVSERLEGAEGNRDGYSDVSIAEQKARIYRKMLSLGFEELYDHRTFGGAAAFRMTWIAYDTYPGGDPRGNGWLSPSLSFGGNRYEDVVSGLALLDRAVIQPMLDSKLAKDRLDSDYPEDVERSRPGDWCVASPRLVSRALDSVGAIRVIRWETGEGQGSYRMTELIRDPDPLPRFRDDGILSLFGVERIFRMLPGSPPAEVE